MTDPTAWQTANKQYLTAPLAWLRLRLQRLLTPSETIDLTEAAETIAAHETADPPPVFVILGRRFCLSRFERQILLLCIAIRVHPLAKMTTLPVYAKIPSLS